MAGRIKDEDIELVRERARIDEIIEQHVTLRNAGGGSRKGLCPFHDEKTPSFQVTPARGFYYCFGCGASGDVFTFLREIEGLAFVEAVERLAAKYGVTLRYEDSGTPSGPRRDPRLRSRLLQAHLHAAEFYAQALAQPAAVDARRFLDAKGFDQAACERFGVGYAPRAGEVLVDHLRGLGFTAEELTTADLARKGSRGLYDRFRGRVMWPIRETNGDVIGFGARRLFDDDPVQAKYLNTGDTPIYKKSHVLYGLDLARREIASSGRAVIVEGYTDVMACHLAGVTSAVATCGTAFGKDHAGVLRRLMSHQDAFHGEVIFTFDGDAAGQSAAMKAFSGDDEFGAQTYVVVVPNGMDPCDLRLADGDAAVRELIATRTPLYRFALDHVVQKYDLDRADQRVDALREALGLVTAIRDRSKVDEFLREIATSVGVEVDQVRREWRRVGQNVRSRPIRTADPITGTAAAGPPLGAPEFADEREALKGIVQFPHLAKAVIADVGDNDFTHPLTLALWRVIAAAGLPEGHDDAWAARLMESIGDAQVKNVLSRCAVEPLPFRGEVDARYIASLVIRLSERTVGRHIVDLKSKLQRTNPVEETDDYNRMFGQLIALEAKRREIRERMLGDEVR